ncbi:MAG: hypothetical protein JSV09_04125 [Thermoplasmata archaeon]|nr:MAG: hypothetical protein JSV09_04125 [Thermoplasmata archaeon]
METVFVNNKTNILRNLEDAYELSPLQQDNLRRYINAPGEGLFHENLLFNYTGKIDTNIFRRCWERILERHSILRTAFFHTGLKKPIQAVQKKVMLPLDILDWRNMSKEKQEKTLDSMMEKDRMKDYLLEQAPLMRLTLILTGSNTFSFWWRFHHMLMDGWAFTIVLWDFLSLYRSYYNGGGEPDILPGYDYREYISWRKNRETAREEIFWTKYLDGYVPQRALVKLKAPEPGSITSKVRQGRIDYDIAELFQPIQNVIKAHELTLNAVFQGIYTLLMSHYCGGELDMITGSTAADRPLSLENSHARVGLFVNTLPVRYKIKPEEKFVEWGKDLQTSIMNTFQYSSSSEQDIKRWCDIPEDVDIFHTALIFKNIPLAEDPFLGLEFRMKDYSLESRPHYPLSVFVWPDENLELKIIYDNKRYSEESAHDVLRNIIKGLERLIENPDITVKEIMQF